MYITKQKQATDIILIKKNPLYYNMFNALSNCISLIARNIALSLNPGISARLNAEFENTHILKHSKKKLNY